MSSVEERIDNALRSHSTSLDLSFNGLKTLPPEVAQLTHLQALHLRNNRLESLPIEIFALDRLQYLDLRNNRLDSLPPEVGQLSGLRTLHLRNNRLCGLPPEIGKLTQLRALHMRNNRLASLPLEIGELAQMQTLDLRNNELTSLPSEIGELAQMLSLQLGDNQLQSLPPEIGKLSRLWALYLHGSDALGLPPEILGPGPNEGNPARPAEILEFYFRGGAESTQPLLEAKVLVVGQGGVGKTSLVARLVADTFDADAFEDNRAKTEGIDIVRWQVESKEGTDPIRVNIWDFGGQEIMHATHQFFLTRRSLYVLVLDARKGENESNLYYWLRLIQSFGGDSPVLVVTNKSEPPNLLELNENRLAKDYAPNIRGFFRTSCLDGRGVPELEIAIGREIRALEHVYNAVPESFLETKDALETRTRSEDFLAVAEYESLCAMRGITKRSEQTLLLRFLHDLGSVLHFSDPDSPYPLEETKILNPEWVTRGVYKILNSNALMQKGGVLTLGLLTKILTRAEGYPKSGRLFIVGMMRKFELCFDFADGSNRLLVPELLSRNEPDLGLDEREALRFEYHYDVLPDGILPRFIVRTHAHLTGKPTYWRSGVLLAIDGNRALVRGDTQVGRIYIAVFDETAGRRRALSVLRAVFEGIHRTIPGVGAKEMVTLPGDVGEAVKYEYLRALEAAGERIYLAPDSLQPFEIRALLDGVEEPERNRETTHRGDIIMGDKYEIRGQAAGVGRHAVAEGNTFQQVFAEAASGFDLPALADELGTLREALQVEASETGHYLALAEVSEAEKAARADDGSQTLQRLKAAGEWAFEVATKIGTSLAAKAIQASLGL